MNTNISSALVLALLALAAVPALSAPGLFEESERPNVKKEEIVPEPKFEELILEPSQPTTRPVSPTHVGVQGTIHVTYPPAPAPSRTVLHTSPSRVTNSRLTSEAVAYQGNGYNNQNVRIPIMRDHIEEHPPIVTRIYPYGRSSPPILFCNRTEPSRPFNRCNLESEANFVPFELSNDGIEWTMRNAHRERYSHRSPNPVYNYHSARVKTPFMIAEYANACLHLAYEWVGKGRKTLTVLQRAKQDDCVYADQYETYDERKFYEPIRKEVEIQLDFKDGNTMLFLEFTFDIGQQGDNTADMGKIRISKLTTEFGTCRRNMGFKCTDPAKVDYIDM